MKKSVLAAAASSVILSSTFVGCSNNSSVPSLQGQQRLQAPTAQVMVPIRPEVIAQAKAAGITIPSARPMLPAPINNIADAVKTTFVAGRNHRYALSSDPYLSRYPAPLIPTSNWGTPPPTPTPRPTPAATRTPVSKCGDAKTDITCPESTKAKRMDLVYQDDGGGQEGYATSGGSAAGNGSFYVAHEVLTNVQLNTPQPGDQQQDQVLYAPTTHGPNGNCFEIVTGYTTGYETPNGTTYPELAVYNFCNPQNGQAGSFVGNMQMNQAFINQYTAVFANGNGTLEYVAEVLLGSDNEWHFLLWDVANNKYDDLTDSNPGQMSNFNGGQGWTLFETHYAQGSCSNVPSTSMSGLRYYVNGSWQYATANRPIYNGSYNPSDDQMTSCFDNSDDSGSTFYGIDFMQSPDYGWTSETYTGQTYG